MRTSLPIRVLLCIGSFGLAACGGAATQSPPPASANSPAASGTPGEPPAQPNPSEATTATSAPPASDTPAPSALEQGRVLTARFYERKTAELWPQLSAEMQTTLGSPEKLAAFRQEIDGQLGTETQVLDEAVSTNPPYRIYLRTASFSKSKEPVIVQWALASDGKVAGFFIKPRPTQLEGKPAQAAKERGQALTADFYQGKTAELFARMLPTMQQALGSKEKFADVRKQVATELGTETKVLDEKVAQASPYTVYVRTVAFSKFQGSVVLQWAFDAEGKIAGFFIRPAN